MNASARLARTIRLHERFDMLPSAIQSRMPEFIKRPMRELRDHIRWVRSRINERALYIVGHPRSGTTAIGRLLGRYTGLSVADEMGWATRHVEAVFTKRISIDTVLNEYRYAFGHAIVQTPGLTPVLGALHERLPHVRFLYIIRDPRDVLCSIVALSNRHRTEAFEIRDPSFTLFRGAWLGIDEQDPIRTVGHRWCRYLDIAASIPEVAYYRYEDFCHDKAEFIARLAQSLGLDQQESLDNQLDVQYRDHGPVRGAGRWRQDLPPDAARVIERICASWMHKFSYATGPDAKARSGVADDA